MRVTELERKERNFKIMAEQRKVEKESKKEKNNNKSTIRK